MEFLDKTIFAAAALAIVGFGINDAMAAEAEEFLDFSESVLVVSPEAGEANMMSPNMSDFGIGQIVLYVKAPNKDLRANTLCGETVKLLHDGETLYEVGAVCNPASDANAYAIIEPPTYLAMGDYEDPANPFKDLLFIGFVFNDYNFVGGIPGTYRLEIPAGFFTLGGKALSAYAVEYNVGKYWSAVPEEGSATLTPAALDRITVNYAGVNTSKRSSTISYSEYASAKWKMEFNGEDVSDRYDMSFNKGVVDFVVKEGMELGEAGDLKLSIDHGYFTFNGSVASVPVEYAVTAVKGTSGIEVAGEVAPGRTAQGVYTLTGVKVLEASDAESISTLPAGIYLAGGRKIIVK